MSELSEAAQKMKPRTAQHDLLSPFEGTFSTVVKLWMGPGEPMISTGSMVNDWVLGGCYLRQTFMGDPFEGAQEAFEGTGFWGYDPTLGVYQGFWVDNASTIMQLETGTVDETGKVWTMTGSMPNPGTGELMKKRSVITLQDHDHHLVESFFSESADSEFKAMELRYTRTA